VHFITAACENMVSGRATRPGDVHLSAAGLTVEVNDTDAEGRLTLADAIWYAQEQAGAKVGRGFRVQGSASLGPSWSWGADWAARAAPAAVCERLLVQGVVIGVMYWLAVRFTCAEGHIWGRPVHCDLMGGGADGACQCNAAQPCRGGVWAGDVGQVVFDPGGVEKNGLAPSEGNVGVVAQACAWSDMQLSPSWICTCSVRADTEFLHTHIFAWFLPP
jgi:hypothetical protein